jgi:radical SAM protein with 4Fe4S-binding SPASM domain
LKNYNLEHVDLEINHRCNLTCRHCSARAVKGKETNELSIEEIKKVLSEAVTLGLKKVGLTGGEPLYDIPKLEKIIAFCRKDLNIPLHTHLNGTLVTEELCKEGNILSSFESISITFLGGDKETHENMTSIKGSFEQTLRGTELIAKAKLPLTCYYIPTHGTCESFRKLTPQLVNIGVKRIRAMALAPSGRARPIYGETAPLSEEMEKFERDLLDSRDKFNLHIEAGYCTRLSMPGLAVLSGHDKCMSGRNRLHINSKGDVFPCTAASGVKELKLGNLKATNLRDIWLNSDTLGIIREIHNGGFSLCKECERKPKCKYGCTVNACGTMPDTQKKLCPITNPELIQVRQLK